MKLLLDVMCGGLDSYLRMCGYDAVYAGDRDLEADDDLLAVARDEGRTLVTRDVQLAGRADDAILLDSREVEAQLAELADAGLDLTLDSDPAYCGRCNGPLDAVPETATTPDYAPDPGSIDVWSCRRCGQHFWRGSHWDRVERTLSRVGEARTDPAGSGDEPRESN